MTLPPPGTFRLHPYAEPPLGAGAYTLAGDVGGLPGPVAPHAARVDVVAPRFALPPDQILSTFPPAGARGSFTARLPQVVLRRRTLPWERSTDLAGPAPPTPWLALVLLAEGEGRLLTDVEVGQTVTPGVSLPGEADVPKSACIEIPSEVVDRTFPAREDLALLCHVREVDLADTELAGGDDDGWLAVVLCNRLPQPGVRYLACLINVEGQVSNLPSLPDADLEESYPRGGAVLDLRAEALAAYGPAIGYDAATMKLPGARASAPAGPAGGAPQRPFVIGAAGEAATPAEAWAAGPVADAPGAAYREAAAKARAELADGWSIDLGVLTRPMLRFPALAYWSFACEESGDFEYLARNINARMYGHVPTGPETPDGDPIDPDHPQPPGNVVEPAPARPLPLVAETGHVVLDHASRAGEPAPAWYRGPLTPLPVPRAEPRPDGRPPLAHHADQLRRVVPDGQEDLGYAAAFEAGRMLALSQPGVVAALARWRQDAYAAARTAELGARAVAEVPEAVRELAARPDPLASEEEAVRPATLGPRAVRALADVLAADGAAALGTPRPLAEPSAVAADLDEALGDRDSAALAGLGVGGLSAADAAALLARLAAIPVATAPADPERSGAALRAALEGQAMRLAGAAEPAPGAAGDALDDLLDGDGRRSAAGEGTPGEEEPSR